MACRGKDVKSWVCLKWRTKDYNHLSLFWLLFLNLRVLLESLQHVLHTTNFCVCSCCFTRAGRFIVEDTVRLNNAVDPHEVSLLFILWHLKTVGGIHMINATEGGAQVPSWAVNQTWYTSHHIHMDHGDKEDKEEEEEGQRRRSRGGGGGGGRVGILHRE